MDAQCLQTKSGEVSTTLASELRFTSDYTIIHTYQ